MPLLLHDPTTTLKNFPRHFICQGLGYNELISTPIAFLAFENILSLLIDAYEPLVLIKLMFFCVYIVT